jgi:hypothetical protein
MEVTRIVALPYLLSFFAMSESDNGDLEVRTIYFPIKLFIDLKNTCSKNSAARKEPILHILYHKAYYFRANAKIFWDLRYAGFDYRPSLLKSLRFRNLFCFCLREKKWSLQSGASR